MSYLQPPRLHFCGRFRANPATVNNDVGHYDSAKFDPSYWDLMAFTDGKLDLGKLNGWWNPAGDGTWRLLGCTIQSIVRRDGTLVNSAALDPAIGLKVSDSGERVAAKMVDIDPQQQMVSELWGLTVRICDAAGATLMAGEFSPSGFFDIWSRKGSDAAQDDNKAACWQSVLTNIKWADRLPSPFLQELAAATDRSQLSIKLNVDRYCMNPADPAFKHGRLVGVIGPYVDQEPFGTVRGRQLVPMYNERGQPQNGFNAGVAILDAGRRRIHLDLGNSLPEPAAGAPTGSPLSLRYIKPPAPGEPPSFPLVDHLGVLDATWYEHNGGMITVPATRPLTDDEWADLQHCRLALCAGRDAGTPQTVLTECVGGYYVAADRLTARLNPGDTLELTLYADRFGQAYAHASILCYLDASGLQSATMMKSPAPAFGTPAEALQFPARVTSGADGRATLTITARDPGNPRGYIDGQIYGLRYVLTDTLQAAAITGLISRYAFKPSNFLSILVWSSFLVPERLQWEDVRPILLQYRNLFPVMHALIDLTDLNEVMHNRQLLRMVFELPPEDPNYMPVSRDLSAAKRQALLRWLDSIEATAPDRAQRPRPFGRPPEPSLLGPTKPTAPHPGGKTAAETLQIRRRLS